MLGGNPTEFMPEVTRWGVCKSGDTDIHQQDLHNGRPWILRSVAADLSAAIGGRDPVSRVTFRDPTDLARCAGLPTAVLRLRAPSRRSF